MRLQLTILGACAGLLGCNPDPGETEQVVDYRAGTDGATSGERGNVKISEVLWTGSASARGERDQSDVFVEFRNEGAFPINMSGWHLILEGSVQRTWRIPDSGTSSRSRPSSRISPSTIQPGGLTSPITDRAETDFPQPLSPTSPRVRPLSSTKLIPSTARTTPSSVKKWVFRSLT